MLQQRGFSDIDSFWLIWAAATTIQYLRWCWAASATNGFCIMWHLKCISSAWFICNLPTLKHISLYPCICFILVFGSGSSKGILIGILWNKFEILTVNDNKTNFCFLYLRNKLKNDHEDDDESNNEFNWDFILYFLKENISSYFMCLTTAMTNLLSYWSQTFLNCHFTFYFSLFRDLFPTTDKRKPV